MATREEVYKAIDGERDYQDSLWTELDKENKVGDFLVYIRNYVDEAFKVHYKRNSLDSVRKIAGLCVACMENFGAPTRTKGRAA
jgi:hypothetical protein